MFRERLITAFMLLALVFAAIAYLPPILFGLAFAAIIVWGAWEWSHLMGVERIAVRLSYLALIAALLALTSFIPITWVIGFSMVLWVVCAYWITQYPKVLIWSSQPTVGLLGCVIFPAAWSSIMIVRFDYDASHLIVLLFLVWATDTGAYVFGRLFGRNKLIPHVSPGKTVEGLFGGMLCGMCLFTGLSLLFQVQDYPWPYYLVIGLCTTLFSVIGDLLISMLKRQRNIKDSGHLLPGHGGLLDRIDSLMAAAPSFLFGLLLLNLV